MTIYYIDGATGNDTTGDGSSSLPWKTVNKGITSATAGDEIRLAKTASASTITGADVTWTFNSNTVATSASLVGTIAIGDIVGRPIASGNGSWETYYKVTGINATTITLECKYYGTTGTDTNAIKRVVPTDSFSPASGTALMNISNKSSLTISGGWNLSGTPTQDGETWLKHLGAKTTSTNGGINLTGTTTNIVISKVNIADCYRGIFIQATNTITSDCTFVNNAQANVDVNTGTNNTFENCIGTSTSNGNSYSYSINVPCSFTNCMSFAGFIGSCVIFGASINGIVEGLTCFGTGTNLWGFTNVGAGAIIKNCTMSYCHNAIRVIYPNIVIDNCTFTNCTIGVNVSNSLNGLYVNNCTFTNCSEYGVYGTSARGIEINSCVFTSCAIDVYGDGNCSDFYSINNTHTTPTNFSYSRVAGTGIFSITNCTIDAPSIGKAYNVITVANYYLPQYVLQNSFGGQYGAIYANGQVTRDTVITSTTGQPTLKFQYTNTIANNNAYTKIASWYANSSTAHTINYELRANGSWSGTLIPVIKLNGVIIKTGTSITSISNGLWDAKTLSVTTGEVTSDGELSLEFNVNANNIAINIGDIEVI